MNHNIGHLDDHHIMTEPTAIAAVRAAQHAHEWGPFAARRYCERRGVPAGLYRLARQLVALATHIS